MTKYLVNNFIPRSEIKQENKDWVTATYWNAIASADWAIGEIIKSLTMHDLFKNTIIVILGDHGEALFDDGFLGHGHAINDIQTKIPLIVNDPTIVIDEPIGQVDVAEITVRSALGLTNHWAQKNKVVFQVFF
jgi:arylsulfatase A-like enzyme